jgi:hypothetical protein
MFSTALFASLAKSLTQATLELIYINITHDIFRVIKSRRMRLAGHLARIGRGEMYTVIWWGNLSANSKRRITKKMLENTICANVQSGNFLIHPRTICANAHEIR